MNTANPDHLDVRRSIDERVSALMSTMTLREKCYQLTATAAWNFVTADGGEAPQLADTLAKAPGNLGASGGSTPKELATTIGRVQRLLVDKTRLGIPALFHAEALNGFVAPGHAVFPTAIGLAATWSPDLVEEMTDLIRRQMRRAGVHQALSPNMDVAFDPRWGRVHETYGEDPYLTAAFSVAFTRGLQGARLAEGVAATAKHFVGYGAPQGGVNLSAFEGGSRRLRDLYAYPFEAAIQLAGLASVMNSYSTVDSVPVGVSRAVLTDLLRGTLGFTGFVASDYTTTEHLVGRQHVAGSPSEAARLSLAAGLDVELPAEYAYGDVLATEVESGRLDENYVDLSVRRLLSAKFALGLFENPFPAENIEIHDGIAEGADLSRELAQRSVVLLKNDGILPLREGLRVAVVGPHADAVELQYPTYTYPASKAMLEIMAGGGFGNAVGVDPLMAQWFAPSNIPIADYVRSEHGAIAFCEAISRHAHVTTAPGSGLVQELGDDQIERAVAAAREADVVILALGGASLWFNGERTEGEASDSADIALPAAQVRLARAIAALDRPTVTVLFQGRAYTLPEEVLESSAILIGSYGGTFGAEAVADVLFGQVEPTGKLPYSIPRHTGQIPVYHHQPHGTGYRNPLPPGVETLYLDYDATPLFGFGHGLTFTRFRVEEVSAPVEVDTREDAVIEVRLTNIGVRKGTATAQLYVSLESPYVTRPAQQLAGFHRVELEAGESRSVTFRIPSSLLAYTNIDHDLVVEPGPVRWFVGLDSADRATEGCYSLTGSTIPVTAATRAFFSRSEEIGAR